MPINSLLNSLREGIASNDYALINGLLDSIYLITGNYGLTLNYFLTYKFGNGLFNDDSYGYSVSNCVSLPFNVNVNDFRLPH